MCREKSSGEKYSVYASKGMSENQRQPFRERRSGGYLKDVSGVSRFSAVAYRCVSEKYLSAHPVMDANPQSQHFQTLAVRSPRRFIFVGTEANNSAVITSGPSRPERNTVAAQDFAFSGAATLRNLKSSSDRRPEVAAGLFRSIFVSLIFLNTA